MLDPRIYRTSLVAVALALIVVAFSLQHEQGALSTTLVPDAFNGSGAYAGMVGLARAYPERRPGSAGDDALATLVGQRLAADGFQVSTRTATAQTIDGSRTLETVVGQRPGVGQGSIVIVTHRDATGAPATSELSGTAVLLELARVLSGETTQHSIVLVSTSGSGGAAGAHELAGQLPAGTLAVIALGDLASPQVREPVVIPFSDRPDFAPPLLRNTLNASLAAETRLTLVGPGLGSQLAHLALPLSLTEEAPFNALGIPAVELSLAGEREPAPDVSPGPVSGLAALGRAVLRAVNALDGAASVPAPSAYLLYKGKVVPGWAIRLLALALILPVLGVVLDGTARARRRGSPLFRWLAIVLASGLPAAAAIGMILLARAVGALPATPPGAVAPGAIPLGADGVLVLLATLLAIVAAALLRVHVLPIPRREGQAGWRTPGAAAMLMLVLCAAALAIWLENPAAALLLIPALHLWAWALDPDLTWARPLRLALWLVGLVPPALVVLAYALDLRTGPVGLSWSGLLLIAGGQFKLSTLIEWCVLLGCTGGAAAAVLARDPREQAGSARASVRGPITYAGPGSLGGTESALRR